jgi:hypothetical protein
MSTPPKVLVQALDNIRTRRLKDIMRFIPHWRNYESWLKFELFAEMTKDSPVEDDWTMGMEIPYQDSQGRATAARCDLFLGPVVFTESKLWKAAGPGTWVEIKSLLKRERWPIDRDLQKLKDGLRGASKGAVLLSTWTWMRSSDDFVGPNDVHEWYPSATELTDPIKTKTAEGIGEARFFWIAAPRS